MNKDNKVNKTETNDVQIQADQQVAEVNQAADDEKARNYSFSHRSDETLDAIEEGDDILHVIPAQPGSTYWAILRIGYEHADQPLRTDEYIDLVAELLEERDAEKWERYRNKDNVTTHKNGQKVQKDANGWRKRLETNIKTLTRTGGSNPYGQRLIERGHILRWEPDQFNGEGGFVLRTDTNQPLSRQKKSKKQSD